MLRLDAVVALERSSDGALLDRSFLAACQLPFDPAPPAPAAGRHPNPMVNPDGAASQPIRVASTCQRIASPCAP